jgi:aspartyl/asparaginyl beta-hydroxylase (cupin superfamily)
MVLDARTRSSIYGKLAPILGEHDANALMSQFPSVEADELVTKQFLRAELADLRTELADLRTEMAERFHQQTLWFGGALGAATALLAAIGLLG